MKKLSILLVIGLLLFGCAGMAFAAPIAFPTNVVDFSGTGTDPISGRTYLQITDDTAGFQFNNFTYTHNLGILDPPAVSLASAVLSITHRNNSNDSYELWYSHSGSDRFIGRLLNSSQGWVTNSWSLSSDILAEISGASPWSLIVKLGEFTNGSESVWLDKSELNGTYTAVPEPATMSLLGLGLLGLLRFRRKA